MHEGKSLLTVLFGCSRNTFDLADENRITILDALQNGPLTKTQLAKYTELSEPEVEEHISKLNSLAVTTVDNEGRFRLANTRVIIEPLHWPESTIKSTFKRDCMECGKTIQITIFEDGTYEGGHYFGEFTVPDEESEGEYEKTGEWEGYDVVEWSGEEKNHEYWECDDCYWSNHQ